MFLYDKIKKINIYDVILTSFILIESESLAHVVQPDFKTLVLFIAYTIKQFILSYVLY